ncbi:FadR/GntR family transcriptional regulator [Arthrobacter sp. Soil764]|uniref:FadR/GntR family transcriptional regulator n=1 Tax=Arthrobacter sp. Soil764 TaxID=1736403 RepID=UPI000700B8D6|nr:FadR/GntR family transcriptional regulator [Arthrobacter sp. Soil764]KRE81445.1 GntR family transcriptional regulator [Arthrobacter sp. Soil764]
MAMNPTWGPIRQGNVSDLIAQRILEVIRSDELRPGDRLPPERELASMLGVGRPALREALRALKAQGRVNIRHGSGVFVADPAVTANLRSALQADDLDLEELYDMREVLELPAAAWAAQNGDADKLDAVVKAYEAITEASLQESADWKRLEELDAAFHLRIVEAAGNRFLVSTQGVLQEILIEGMETTLRVPGRLEKSRRDHKRILDAILAGDPVAARRAARIHIEGARRAALERRKQDDPSVQAS